MSEENWRAPQTDALTFLNNAQKRANVESRRPDIRKASDIVGPGIALSAVRVTNWNDVLATFNGYYSSMAGAAGAPNLVENFVGSTLMDSEFGGTQTLTGMASGQRYFRTFLRRQADAESISYGGWSKFGGSGLYPDTEWQPLGLTTEWGLFGNGYDPPSIRRYQGFVVFKNLVTRVGGASTSPIAYLPAGFRPRIGDGRSDLSKHTSVQTANGPQLIRIRNDGFMGPDADTGIWVDLGGIPPYIPEG